MGSEGVNGSAEGVNLAAYVCGINDLKVQPYELPAVLGKYFTSFPKHSLPIKFLVEIEFFNAHNYQWLLTT